MCVGGGTGGWGGGSGDHCGSRSLVKSDIKAVAARYILLHNPLFVINTIVTKFAKNSFKSLNIIQVRYKDHNIVPKLLTFYLQLAQQQ